MFPPFERASKLDQCLNPIWEQAGDNVPNDSITPYHDHFKSIISDITNTEDQSRFIAYMEAARRHPPFDKLPSIYQEDVESDPKPYHPELIKTFYTRTAQRTLDKAKTSDTSIETYFDLTNDEESLVSRRKTDIETAVNEELDELARMHGDVIGHRHDIKQNEIRRYKFRNTWFKDNTNDQVLNIIECLTDSTDKAISVTKRGISLDNQLHSDSSSSSGGGGNTLPDKNSSAPNGFQIGGMVISVLYLGISIFTPLYKKYKLNYNEPLLNKWSVRYLITSAILLSLGAVAMAVPIVGFYSGIVFSAYSLGNNIFKVALFFKNRAELKRDIKTNREKIDYLSKRRDELDQEIKDLKSHYRMLDLNHPSQAAKNCANNIRACELLHKSATEDWLAAKAQRQVLKIKQIRNLDTFTTVSNVFRMAIAAAALAGVILSVIPFTQPIGAIILITTTFVGAAAYFIHTGNKFHLINEEQRQVQIKQDRYENAMNAKFPDYQPRGKLNSSAKLFSMLGFGKPSPPEPAHKPGELPSHDSRPIDRPHAVNALHDENPEGQTGVGFSPSFG